MNKFRGLQKLEKALRSVPNTEECYHRFYNLTERTVDVIWITYDGEGLTYRTLKVGQYVDVNTFKDHPWIAVDHFTKDWLEIDGRDVYFPVTFREYFQTKFQRSPFPCLDTVRTSVNITLPLFSLRQNCLQVVKQNLKDSVEIDSLELPKSVIQDLQVLSKESKYTAFR